MCKKGQEPFSSRKRFLTLFTGYCLSLRRFGGRRRGSELGSVRWAGRTATGAALMRGQRPSGQSRGDIMPRAGSRSGATPRATTGGSRSGTPGKPLERDLRPPHRIAGSAWATSLRFRRPPASAAGERLDPRLLQLIHALVPVHLAHRLFPVPVVVPHAEADELEELRPPAVVHQVVADRIPLGVDHDHVPRVFLEREQHPQADAAALRSESRGSGCRG